MSQILEIISEAVHDAWWEEKKKQGFHAPVHCPNVIVSVGLTEGEYKEMLFTERCDKCHTDMYPYSDLPENIKEYDRVTVRTVLKALVKGC